VLWASRPDLPLALRLPESAGPALAAFRVERALIQVTVADLGQQTYRARFLLSQAAVPFVDVELPAPLFLEGSTGLRGVLFRGKGAAWVPVDDGGQKAALSKVGRVTLEPDAAGGPAGGVLEIDYVLAAGRAAGSSALQSTLLPPLLHGDAGLATTRWQVTLPPGWVPLSQDGGLGPDYAWGRRGWLLAPRPAVTSADLERWLTPERPAPAGGEGGLAPAVVGWRTGSEPLHLTHAPQQAWLLLCSLALLALGLGLVFLSLPRVVFWAAAVAVGGGALFAGLFWPGLLAAVLYGCQLGAVVLLPLLGFHWLLQQRYRRRVVFLPSFTRLKTGSALQRPGSSNRPRGEPSTVDAPPTAEQAESGAHRTGSSVSR
jgi:hypothetical protein